MSLDMQAKHPRLTTFFTTLREYAIFGILAAAAALVIFGVINVIQNRDQQTALDKQLETTNQLVGQVKALSEENKKLSQTAANYAYCNATILAKYTQTGDPITVEDLEKCKFTSYPDNGSPTSFNDGQGGQDNSPSSALAGAGNSSSNTNTGTTSNIPNSNNSNGSNNGGGTTNPPSQPPVNNPPTTPPPTTPAATPLLALQTPLLPPVSLYPPCLQVSKLLYLGKDAIALGCR